MDHPGMGACRGTRGQRLPRRNWSIPNSASRRIVWRLFHEEREVRVLQGDAIARGCRCSVVHFEQVLARFPKEDRKDMRDEMASSASTARSVRASS